MWASFQAHGTCNEFVNAQSLAHGIQNIYVVQYWVNKNLSLYAFVRTYHKYTLKCILIHTAAAAKLLQSCPTLCDPIDSSAPGPSVPGILQARILEWVAISFSNACMLSHFSRVRLYVTLWTAAHQVPLSTGFSRQEYWSELPFPSSY